MSLKALIDAISFSKGGERIGAKQMVVGFHCRLVLFGCLKFGGNGLKHNLLGGNGLKHNFN